MDVAFSRDPVEQNCLQVLNNTGVNIMLHKPVKGLLVAAMGGHVGGTEPSYKVSNQAIEMEESSSGHGRPTLIDSRFCLPVEVVTTQRVEINVDLLIQGLGENRSRIVSRAQLLPVRYTIGEEATFPKGKENMPQGCIGRKRLGEVFLTKGLVNFCLNTGVDVIQEPTEICLGCLGEHRANGRVVGNNLGHCGVLFLGAGNCHSGFNCLIRYLITSVGYGNHQPQIGG